MFSALKDTVSAIFDLFVCRFFVSAPRVFHVGVNEKVLVQTSRLNTPFTLYLEHESSGTVVSGKKTTHCTEKEKTKTVELMV